ncbi:MAG TPA: hypothetical protein VFI96_05630, partial [Longimicrobiaceae bacterium]|nr:hypothetical protein [Longimicrobiaceae bacterium]
EADVALGVREMMHLFGAAGPPDAATRARLVDDLLRAVLEGENPWPRASPFMRAPHFEPILHTREKRPVFLVADSLPAEVREHWKERVHLISRAELRARSDRLPALYFTLSPVQVAGPFARIGISYGERESRAFDEAPIGYAGSTTAYLLRTPDGWMLVALQRWVT